jgi:hypothetical protein
MAKKPPAKRQPSKRAPSPSAPKATIDRIEVAKRFKLIFITTALLTFGFFVAAVVISVRGDNSPMAKEAASHCFTLTKIGFGAIIGLLGGKAL